MKINPLLSLILLLAFHVAAQEDPELPEITPPSPTAYELGKYGQIPVGMFTGTPNVDIPLYSYGANGLSVPISLSYSSNGIKVDQLSSNVGLGWNLNVGGVVTRIVRDEADEERQVYFPDDDIHEPGGLISPMALDFFYLGGQDGVDTETDLFSYSFMGYSGKFIVDNMGEIVPIPNNDMSVSGYYENGETGFMITAPDGVQYIFLDSELTKNQASGGGYHPVPEFKTTAWYLTRIVSPKSGEQINFVYANQGYSYTLSRSESLKVNGAMEQNGCPGTWLGTGYTITSEMTNALFVSGKRLVEINSSNPLRGKVLINSINSHPAVAGYKLVSSIEVFDGNDEPIESFGFDYLATPNDRVFLQGIAFTDPDKSYAFDYIDPNGFPGRLSKAQDYWGYYNGKTSNQYWFPNPQDLEYMPAELIYFNIGADKAIDPLYSGKGLMDKITYPTKGYTEFSYEQNSYWGEYTTYPNETNLALTVSTDDGQTGTAYQQTATLSNIPFDQKISFSVYVSFNSQDCTEDTLHSKASVYITDNQTSSNVPIQQLTQSGYVAADNLFEYDDSEHIYYADLLEGHSYTVKLVPNYFCTNAILNVEYYNEVPTTQYQNLPSGGKRIKEIRSYASANAAPEITRYYYGKKETLDQSSGEKGQTAYFLSKQTNRTSCSEVQCGYVDQHYTILNSTSMRPLFNSSSNGTTYYRFVTVSFGGDSFEKGGEENEFIVHNDYPGNPIKGNPIESSPWVNAGWDNSLLKKRTLFKADGTGGTINLRETINNYILDNRYFKEVYGYAIQKKFDLVCTGDVTYECTASDLTKTFEQYYCAANHDHHWLLGNHTVCIASGNDMQVHVFYHPCHGNNVGDIITRPDYLENLDITEYTTNSYWHYLNQTVEKRYDQNGSNPVETVTNYYYDNLNHLQLTRKATVGSDGTLEIDRYFYPDDVATVSSLGNDDLSTGEYDALDELKTVKSDDSPGQYRINEPVQIDHYRDSNDNGIGDTNELIRSQRTNYKDWGSGLVLPEYIQTLKGIYNATANRLQDRIQFLDYYANGNAKELLRTNGTHIVYIWGYNQQYPIAKIENATYSQVQSYVANLQSLSDADDDRSVGTAGNEGALRSALDALRANLPDAMVTTYTYDPLVGVTSITDPRGQTAYYEYDSFNRLKYVRDSDGNILSGNEYNYADQN